MTCTLEDGDGDSWLVHLKMVMDTKLLVHLKMVMETELLVHLQMVMGTE